jgi:hypothetical protein
LVFGFKFLPGTNASAFAVQCKLAKKIIPVESGADELRKTPLSSSGLLGLMLLQGTNANAFAVQCKLAKKIIPAESGADS